MSDGEILKFVRDSSDPIVTTAEVAEYLEFSKEGARKRLYALAEDGRLDFKKVGRNPAFWITDKGRGFISNELDEDDLPEP
ncbi:hypothetical protein ACFSBX_18935 [Halobellus rarus]|uniref:Uncharacterized protein n=1 Tax=Halobellus rarus TaxID=1126237 RepID=A0ABD6CSE3_9EURY